MSVQPYEPPDPRQLRASDADRERVAGILHRAMADGRITVPEMQERLDQVYAAKVLGELEPVTLDLPEHQPIVAPSPTSVPVQFTKPEPGGLAPRIGGIPTTKVAFAVMSGAERRGEWVVPRQFTAVAVMGGVDLDLTAARFAEPEVSITALAVMGGIDITVPDDVVVMVNGVGFMGGFDHNIPADANFPPGTPVVRVNGLALMGGVDVHRMTARQRKKLEKSQRKLEDRPGRGQLEPG